MTQWRDETDKGERDREITRWDEETGVIMDSKKGKFVPFVGTDVYGSGDGKRKILHRLYLPKERKQWEEWEDAVGCPGCVITVEYVKYTLEYY